MALDPPNGGQKLGRKISKAADDVSDEAAIADLLRKIGGRQEARTPDLRVANAALSQLS